jgi:hypothetical protein
MFAQYMSKTNMLGFWQFIFDYCNENYSCVLGWMLVGIVVFLAVIIGLGVMITRRNKRG